MIDTQTPSTDPSATGPRPVQQSSSGAVLFRWLLIVVAIAPAIWTGSIIYRFGVNVPYWDDWENTVLVHMRYLDGTLTLGGLFYQESDSRPALPRVICLISTIASHSNRRAEMFISLFIVCLTSLNIYLLARRTLPRPQQALWLWALANWLLFSPVQYENWLWGVQMLMFLPIWLFTTALLISLNQSRWIIRVAAAIALWVLSTLCFVSGFFFWPILTVVQYCRAPSRRIARLTLAPWLVSLAITGGLYFRHFKALADTSPPELVLIYPQAALQYFTAYFAAPFRINGMLWMHIFLVGAGVLVLGLLPLVKFLRLDRMRRAQMLPWIAIAAYAVMTGVSTTLGRLNMGVAQSQSSRYTTFSLLLPLAGLMLWAITFARWRAPARYAVVVLGIVFFGGHVVACVNRLTGIAEVSALRREAKAALQRINIDDQNPALADLYPDRAHLKLLANQYAQHGGIPPLESRTPGR